MKRFGLSRAHKVPPVFGTDRRTHRHESYVALLHYIQDPHLSEDGHDFGRATITDPDLTTVQDVMAAIFRRHSSCPDRLQVNNKSQRHYEQINTS